jgi:type II secretory pathway pseudopilin PulG
MNKQKGQIMVEALIALGVAVVIIAAITSMIISALSSAVAAKNQDLATQYAKQGMEVLRNMSKTNWTKFSSIDSGDTPCLDKDSNEPTEIKVGEQKDCGQNIDAFFIRRIDIDKTLASKCSDSIMIKVSVFWRDSKCTSDDLFCHSVNLESCFSNVNNITQ